MKSKKWQEPSWLQLQHDDHRKYLKKLVNSQGSLVVAREVCSPWIHLIVEELHFGSQKTSALSLMPSETNRIISEYLSWINDQGLWIALNDCWSKQAEGPWSIPLFLAASYSEFLTSQYPDLSSKESSISFRKAIVEYSSSSPVPSNRVMGNIAEQLVESFTAWTNTLPSDLRLTYQLHLEGLLNHEISGLLSIHENEVEKRILKSKSELGLGKLKAI